jgi:hypothetical protein
MNPLLKMRLVRVLWGIAGAILIFDGIEGVIAPEFYFSPVVDVIEAVAGVALIVIAVRGAR